MSAWAKLHGELYYEAGASLNLMRALPQDPTMSAWAKLHGELYYEAGASRHSRRRVRAP